MRVLLERSGYQLASSPVELGGERRIELVDPSAIEMMVDTGVESAETGRLRGLLEEAGSIGVWELSQREVIEALVEYIRWGQIWILRGAELPASARAEMTSEVVVTERVERTGTKPEEYIEDWYLRCSHKFDGERRVVRAGEPPPGVTAEKYSRSNHIEVVGSRSDNFVDACELLWRDDEVTPPPTVEYGWRGGHRFESAASTDEGPYKVFKMPDIKYRGEPGFNFLSRSFWSELKTPTRYTVDDGPCSAAVDAFYPHQWKVTLETLPFRSFKQGAKFDGRGPLESTSTSESKTVGGKVQTVDKTYDAHGNLTKSEADSSGPIGPIQVTRDGRSLLVDAANVNKGLETAKQLPNAVNMIGTFLQMADKLANLKALIDKYAPKVGYYMDFEVALLKGTLSYEWGYKEHRDHQVFNWWKVAVAMRLVEIKLEVGVGATVGDEAGVQFFLQLIGAVEVNADVEKVAPEDHGATISGKSLIEGAIGVRVKAGTWVEAEGKGVTGLSFDWALHIGKGDQTLRLDCSINFSGMKVVGSAKVLGAGGHTYEEELMGPSRLGGWSWPREEPYSPPYISRDSMEAVVKSKLTSGWDVRVIKSSGNVFGMGDENMRMAEIVKQIVDPIDASAIVKRDKETIAALAVQIRKELNILGERDWALDYVAKEEFDKFTKERIPAMIDNNYFDPALELAERVTAS